MRNVLEYNVEVLSHKDDLIGLVGGGENGRIVCWLNIIIT